MQPQKKKKKKNEEVLYLKTGFWLVSKHSFGHKSEGYPLYSVVFMSEENISL